MPRGSSVEVMLVTVSTFCDQKKNALRTALTTCKPTHTTKDEKDEGKHTDGGLCYLSLSRLVRVCVVSFVFLPTFSFRSLVVAQCSGVPPEMRFVALTSAPPWISTRAQSTFPHKQAMCSALWPTRFWQDADTPSAEGTNKKHHPRPQDHDTRQDHDTNTRTTKQPGGGRGYGTQTTSDDDNNNKGKQDNSNTRTHMTLQKTRAQRQG